MESKKLEQILKRIDDMQSKLNRLILQQRKIVELLTPEQPMFKKKFISELEQSLDDQIGSHGAPKVSEK